VRFYPNEEEMTDMVLSGESDAGFTKSDIIEELEAKKSDKFKGVFKVLNKQENLEVEGRPFPFQASSQLYPENGLLAMPWVSQVVQREVMQALMRLNKTSDECKVGNNAGWQPALSYGEARDLYTSLGLMKFNEKSRKFQCIRATVRLYLPVFGT
jgi:ABC-type phosphate/phosphonate transport system substrate-binding protein